MGKINKLYFTQEINAFDYLEKAHFFTKNLSKDQYSWKWIILALHGALYGFAICACRGTNNLRVVEKNGKLVGFDKAIKMCQDKTLMNMTVMSSPLILTNEQKNSINFLKKELRNNFEHYTPMSWTIMTDGLPKILIDIFNIIHFLALETGNYVILNRKQQKKVEFYIKNSKNILQIKK